MNKSPRKKLAVLLTCGLVAGCVCFIPAVSFVHANQWTEPVNGVTNGQNASPLLPASAPSTEWTEPSGNQGTASTGTSQGTVNTGTNQGSGTSQGTASTGQGGSSASSNAASNASSSTGTNNSRSSEKKTAEKATKEEETIEEETTEEESSEEESSEEETTEEETTEEETTEEETTQAESRTGTSNLATQGTSARNPEVERIMNTDYESGQHTGNKRSSLGTGTQGSYKLPEDLEDLEKRKLLGITSVSEETESVTEEEQESLASYIKKGLEAVASGEYAKRLEELAKEKEAESMIMGESVVVTGQAVMLMDDDNVAIYGGDRWDASKAASQTMPEGTGEGSAQSTESGNTVKTGGVDTDGAFYHDDSLKHYTIPDDITSIGRFAFARSGLMNINIPEGVEVIGEGAFYHCDDLTSIIIPSTVTEVGADAFSMTPWFHTWELESTSDFLIVGDGVLIAYKGKNADVVIPSDVKTIASRAFADNKFMRGLKLPESVLYIREEAFAGCSNLTDIIGGENVITCASDAFKDSQASFAAGTQNMGENEEITDTP